MSDETTRGTVFGQLDRTSAVVVD